MADPATLPAPSPADAPSSSQILASLSDEQHATWLQTGELPAVASSETEAPALPPSTESAADPDDAAPDATATAAPDKPLGSPRHDPRARFSELTQQRNAEKAAREAAEKRAADLEARLAQQPSTTPAPVAAPVAGTAVYQTPKGPIDYSSGDPEAIRDQFLTAGYADPYAAMNFYGPKAEAQFQRQADEARAAQTRAQSVEARALQATFEAYPDFDPTPLQDVKISATLALSIYEHPAAPALLKHFSEHPAEARALAVGGDVAAALKVGELAARLAVPSTVVPSTPAAKTISTAPAPSTTLGRKPTGAVRDEVQDALDAGDYERFAALENAKELAARKAGR